MGKGEGYFIQPAAGGDHWSPVTGDTPGDSEETQIRIISSNGLKSWGFHALTLSVLSEWVGKLSVL